MVARSRQAEATVSLGTIRDLQKSYYYEDDRGYYHSGLHYGIDKCAAGNPREAGNTLGFKLPDCTKARYRYLTNKGNDCALSDGAIDQGQVYPGCAANDEWSMSSAGKLTHVHDVVSKCPLGISSSTSTCVEVSLPTAPAAPTVSPASPRTPPAPPPPPPLTCDHSICWLLADHSCVQCGIVGGIKTTVPCPGGCKIPKPYVYKPPPPPSVFCYKTCAQGCSNWTTTSSSTYMPAASSVCRGDSFTQTRPQTKTRSCSSLCTGISCSTISSAAPQSRSATGTKDCSPPPPPPSPPDDDDDSGEGGGGTSGGGTICRGSCPDGQGCSESVWFTTRNGKTCTGTKTGTYKCIPFSNPNLCGCRSCICDGTNNVTCS